MSCLETHRPRPVPTAGNGGSPVTACVSVRLVKPHAPASHCARNRAAASWCICISTINETTRLEVLAATASERARHGGGTGAHQCHRLVAQVTFQAVVA